MTEASQKDAIVWDWSVRVFHWSTVALVALLWWSGENDVMNWHRRFGLALMALLIFRIYWGFAGTRTARFSDFVKGPGAILAYMRKLKRPYTPRIGHNALGALSVLALLAALAAQIGFGLFAIDVDGIESGPLAHLVSFDMARTASDLHDANFNLLVGLIGLHVAAVLFYHIALRANLIGPMVTGKRKGATASGIGPFPIGRAVIGVIIAGAAVALTQL
ncbi:cytochrome b/b6 domain-containing protein [Hyphococcus flavus]|uniref:Cytochrome b/b6 domain-containing protein n=1 Tax=Hyphococcus flavus TaxID=1866326 RepID=A0AAE9ZA06_9PROT|nr:cytochrome b/b6 domain-containing protein [Hyphococcus flavus]WDI30249.1 cytochrome b/b6 domain-containing protein [Hyphococcus flavus]